MSRRLLNWRILLARLYRRDPRVGPGHRRGARRQLVRRPLVEHGQPRIAHLREQRRAAAEPQRHPAPQPSRPPGFAPAAPAPALWRRQLLSAPSVLDRAGRRVHRFLAVRAQRLGGRRGGRVGGLDARHAAAALDHRAADLFRGAAVPRAGVRRMEGAAAAPAGRRARRARRRPRRGATAGATSICPMPICRPSRRSTPRCRRPGARAIWRGCGRLMTPEMLGYFSEELTRNASQGVRNIVSDVELLKGELSRELGRGRPAIRHRLSAMAGDRLCRPARAFAGRPGLAGQRRPAPPGRGRGDVDLCPPPRRRLAALRHPAGLTRAPSRNRQLRRKEQQPIGVIFICILGENPHSAALDSWVRPRVGFARAPDCGGRPATPCHHRGSGRRIAGGFVDADRRSGRCPARRDAACRGPHRATASRRSGNKDGAASFH